MSEASMRRSKLNPLNCGCGVLLLPLIVLVAATILCGIVGFILDRLAVETVTGTVQNKYPKRFGSDQSDRYMFEVELGNGEVEVFQDTDTFWWGKFDSADFYAKIEIGGRYELVVVGWRWPFFSTFRNIVSYKSLDDQ